jgi:hypothetical protein
MGKTLAQSTPAQAEIFSKVTAAELKTVGSQDVWFNFLSVQVDAVPVFIS